MTPRFEYRHSYIQLLLLGKESVPMKTISTEIANVTHKVLDLVRGASSWRLRFAETN